MVGRPDGEHGEVGDGAHEGDAHPWAAEEDGRDVEEADQDDVPVKAAALLALLHQDQSKENQKGKNDFSAFLCFFQSRSCPRSARTMGGKVVSYSSSLTC